MRWRRGRKLRFGDAVPLRADRRDLHRHMRQVWREVTKEQERSLGVELRRLADERTAVISIGSSTSEGATALELHGGTLLMLRIVGGDLDLDSPSGVTGQPIATFRGVERAWGHRWYCLYFVGAGGRGSTVLAKVTRPVPQILPDGSVASGGRHAFPSSSSP